jgi:hypothetical protein
MSNIGFIAVWLAALVFVAMCIWVTGALTILSATVYFWVWLKHMASHEPQPPPLPGRKSHPEPIKTGAVSRIRTS